MDPEKHNRYMLHANLEQSLMDEKRKLANGVSAQKSNTKKNEYLADLEEKAKSYQKKIAALHPQLKDYKYQQLSLLIDQHNLKKQIDSREQQKILKEVEIQSHKEKVNWLSELHKQLVEAQAKMLNMGAVMQPMSNSNLNSSSSGRLIGSNLNQASSSTMQWIAEWDNGQRSIPNLNIVKSEPMDQ